MIINIRGTSGSGKTTLVKQAMEQFYKDRNRVMVPGRKQPVGYLLSPEGAAPWLYVVGHYESACGGCDTIASYDENYAHIRKAHSAGYNVLYEGLLISGETRRLIELKDEVGAENILVLALDVELQTCLDSVNARRRAKKPEAPDVNPKNTEAKFKVVKSAMRKLSENGIRTMWLDRAAALGVVRKELAL